MLYSFILFFKYIFCESENDGCLGCIQQQKIYHTNNKHTETQIFFPPPISAPCDQLGTSLGTHAFSHYGYLHRQWI